MTTRRHLFLCLFFLLSLSSFVSPAMAGKIFPPEGGEESCTPGTMPTWRGGSVYCVSVLESVCPKNSQFVYKDDLFQCVPKQVYDLGEGESCASGYVLTWKSGGMYCVIANSAPASCPAGQMLVISNSGQGFCLSYDSYLAGTLCPAGKVFAGIRNGKVYCKSP